VIQTAPTTLKYRKVFTLCTDNPGSISKVTLIRPGATTHAFDQNQRYVELTFTQATNPPRLLVSAPASPDSAPPGYYLLFVTGASDAQAAYPAEVPSIARWVKLDNPGIADVCDQVAPGVVQVTPDLASETAIYLIWSAPGDDEQLPTSGSAQQFLLRRSPNAITNESQWEYATNVAGLQTPGEQGAGHDKTVDFLQSCTTTTLLCAPATTTHCSRGLLPTSSPRLPAAEEAVDSLLAGRARATRR